MPTNNFLSHASKLEKRIALVNSTPFNGKKMIRSATTDLLEQMSSQGTMFSQKQVDDIVRAEKRYLNTYVKKFPYIVAGAKGKYIYLIPIQGTDKGKVRKVYDAFNCYGVASAVGYANNAINTIALRCMQKGALSPANFFSSSRAVLCEYLFHPKYGLFTDVLPYYNIYMLNSGSESNDAALKLVCEFHNSNGQGDRNIIIAMEGGFHGRTGYAIQLTEHHKGFPLINKDVIMVPFGDINALTDIFNEKRGGVHSVFFEPVQGEAGVIPAPAGYLKTMRYLCDKHGALMVADEIQTFARTGSWFASIQLGATPDIITTGKIISGANSPVSIVYAKEGIRFGEHRHGNTYSGNPLACELAMNTLYLIERDGLIENSSNVGNYLMEQLKKRLKNNPLVNEVRGIGGMIGVVLASGARNCVDYIVKAIDEGLLLSAAGSKKTNETLRILPPLAITKKEADYIARTLQIVLK